jgi:predicted ATPase
MGLDAQTATGAVLFLPYRVKGELILRGLGAASEPNDQTEAEACFRKSIEIARQQEAKSFELKAVLSLSQLWMKQGKKADARQTLADIYGWFTEGFSTADLKNARALLDELNE